MQFEWDDIKEQKNIIKHGVDFSTAILIFNDPYRIEMYDEVHSFDEDRYITIGNINGTYMVLTVVYTERIHAIRIISARMATTREKEGYHDYKKNS